MFKRFFWFVKEDKYVSDVSSKILKDKIKASNKVLSFKVTLVKSLSIIFLQDENQDVKNVVKSNVLLSQSSIHKVG